MKLHKKKTLALIVSVCLALTGCEEIINGDYIVDWAPVNIYIYATDSLGNSIISPDMPGMSLTFKDVTYTVKDWNHKKDSLINTKAYLAVLYGLYAEPYYDFDVDSLIYRLSFGEIDGAADMDEDITLNWPDGSVDTIHYHCSDHKEGRTPKCNRSWKLNGRIHDGNIFYFSGK